MYNLNDSRLVYGSQWNGYPLLDQYSPFIENYLYKNLLAIEHATEQYPRIFAIRVDLHLPPGYDETDTSVISRFFESMNSQIYEDYVRHANRGVYLNSCRLRYLWAKERGPENGNIHYHVCLLLNHKRYAALGRYVHSDLIDWNEAQRNMAHRITKAWYSATQGMAYPGLVHFADNGGYELNRNSPDFHMQKAELFKRLSYLAKAWTKETIEGRRYGSSRG